MREIRTFVAGTIVTPRGLLHLATWSGRRTEPFWFESAFLGTGWG